MQPVKEQAKQIFLIGPMGSGKTTVGRLLAKTLKCTFYDTDKEIEKRAGATISWIFDIEGEAGFRRREEQVIAELSQISNSVLATGGGAVLSANTRVALATRGTVIYLRVTLEKQLQRLSGARDRPLIRGTDPEQVLRDLQCQRESLYQELADWVINTDNLTTQAIVEQILIDLGKH